MGNLVAAGEGAVENIKKRGKAEAGDKTLLDSLIPAVETLKKGVSNGNELDVIVRDVVKAAGEGMKSTVNMKAKFGRAQWFAEGSIGIQDGGATAMYYIIKSFMENLAR
jgi:dihydroxyacetone kinase-like protein